VEVTMAKGAVKKRATKKAKAKAKPRKDDEIDMESVKYWAAKINAAWARR
jgi:hypothetical protein